MTSAVVWFRRDVRLSDNPAWAAGTRSDHVVPLFVVDPLRLMVVTQFLILAAALFALGVYGLLVRRNIVLILLSVELMLNAVNINLIAFESMLVTTQALGQIFAIFVITVAAAEVGIGLAIVLMIFRNRRSANVDDLSLMRW